MKVWLVSDASCDCGMLGGTSRCKIFLSKKRAEKQVEEWTKPIRYPDKLEEFEDDRVSIHGRPIEGKCCWRAGRIILIQEKEVE